MGWKGRGYGWGWDFGKIPHIPYIPKCGHLSWERHLDGRYATINQNRCQTAKRQNKSGAYFEVVWTNFGSAAHWTLFFQMCCGYNRYQNVSKEDNRVHNETQQRKINLKPLLTILGHVKCYCFCCGRQLAFGMMMWPCSIVPLRVATLNTKHKAHEFCVVVFRTTKPLQQFYDGIKIEHLKHRAHGTKAVIEVKWSGL